MNKLRTSGIGLSIMAVAFLFAVAGCSNMSPTGPDEITVAPEDEAKYSVIKVEPRSDSDGDTKYTFVFTGVVADFDFEKRLIIFKDKDLVAIVSEKALFVVEPSGFSSRFSFGFVEIGMEVTIYGEMQKDETVLVDRVELYRIDENVETRPAG
jgi:hypothetical protein